MLIQCTPLLEEKAGVTAHKQERVQARKVTQSSKQEQSVAPQNGPWSKKKERDHHGLEVRCQLRSST